MKTNMKAISIVPIIILLTVVYILTPYHNLYEDITDTGVGCIEECL